VRNSKCDEAPEGCEEISAIWPPEKSTKTAFHPAHVIWQDFTYDCI